MTMTKKQLLSAEEIKNLKKIGERLKYYRKKVGAQKVSYRDIFAKGFE